ncbi:hypothetical protein ACFV2X_34535 [Streptomyces sp. NPDC059679]|uniref:hypothetical protein n=1 Tax=Streptomyces sp. NPDC059679 TaxID=3346903 RepID=UPI0036C5D216
MDGRRGPSINPYGDAARHRGTKNGAMRAFHGRRTRAWADAPAHPWATGAVLIRCAAAELALVPWHSRVIAVSVLMTATPLMWRRQPPLVSASCTMR